MRNWTMAILPLAAAMTATGCSGADHDRAHGKDAAARSVEAGPAATRTFALTGFTGVEVTGPDDVTIRQGDAFSISAKGPQAELDELEIKLDGSSLSIGRKREGFSFGRRDHDGVEIAITMPKLGALRLTGSGDIDADVMDGDAVGAVVTGSGDIRVAKLTGKSAEIAVSGSGNVGVAGGTVGTGDYSVTGSGNIEAGGLAATTLDISVTGSGDVAAQATGKADVSILGSGDVDVTGGGACSKRRMGSGSITCK